MLGLVGCSDNAVPPSDPKLPGACFGNGPGVTDLNAAPNPTTAGTPIDIVFTLGWFVDCKTTGNTDPTYWKASARVVGSTTPAPGAITPSSGGPVVPGTPVHITYTATTAVDVDLTIVGLPDPSGSGPSVSAIIQLHVR